jgi:hypothetical protein
MVLEVAVTKRHRIVIAISLVLLAASCGGGGTEVATPSPCTTVTPGPDGSPTPTPTPCPVVDATGEPSAEPTGELVGESWEGTATIASSAVYPEGSATCEDGWELEFTFVATVEGTIGGEGTAEQSSGPTCPFPIGPSLTHYEYQVLGEETAGGFSIRFALGTFGPAGGAEYAGFVSMFGFPAPPSGGPPVSVAVSGTSGTGQGAWQFESGNPPATYSANGTITIECVTCA